MSVNRNHTCSTSNENETLVWNIPRLWDAARDLPVENLPVADLMESLKQTYCFGRAPTCWDMARHAKQVYEADLSYPIILGSEGNLMDGAHRIAKAWMLGMETIKAVRFVQDPEPDERLVKPPSETVVTVLSPM